MAHARFCYTRSSSIEFPRVPILSLSTSHTSPLRILTRSRASDASGHSSVDDITQLTRHALGHIDEDLDRPAAPLNLGAILNAMANVVV